MPTQSVVNLVFGLLFLALLWAFGILPNHSPGFWAILLIAWFGFFIDDKLSKIAKSVESDTEPPDHHVPQSREEEIRLKKEKGWYRQLIAERTLAGALVGLFLLLFFWNLRIPPNAAPVAWVAGFTAWFAFNIEGKLARIANALKKNVVGGHRLRSIALFLRASVNIPLDDRLEVVVKILKSERPQTEPLPRESWHSLLKADVIMPWVFLIGALWALLRWPADSPLLWIIALITWLGLSFDKKLARIARALESEASAHDKFERVARKLDAETAKAPK